MGTIVFEVEGQTFRPSNTAVAAKIQYPYNHIFGLTGNYFEGDFTSAVLRLETAYVLDEPCRRSTQRRPGSAVQLGPQPVHQG